MIPPEEGAQPEELPDTLIEHARSGRSKCKGCRKLIEKGDLRLGVLVEGPYGMGHMWYHLICAAGSTMPKVEEAYASSAWEHAKVPADPSALPDLETLRGHAAKAAAAREEKAKNRKTIPYAELAPSGLSKCKQSGESIPKGAVRIVLGKQARFGNQTRTTPFAVLPEFVPAALLDPEIDTAPEDLVEQLRANSKLEPAILEQAIAAIGELP
jgi:hypothetical protein